MIKLALILFLSALPASAQIFPARVDDKNVKDNLYYLYEQIQRAINGGLSGSYISLTAPFSGDVTGPYTATVVGDDSHSHSNTSLTGVLTDPATFYIVRDGDYLVAPASFTILADDRVLRSGDTMTGALAVTTLTVTGNAFSVGGSTLIINNGNVGIGAASAGSRLSVTRNTDGQSLAISAYGLTNSQGASITTNGLGNNVAANIASYNGTSNIALNITANMDEGASNYAIRSLTPAKSEFTGTVSAPTFIGALNGNADTATSVPQSGVNLSTVTMILDNHTVFISTATVNIQAYGVFLATATSIINAHSVFVSSFTDSTDGRVKKSGDTMTSRLTIEGDTNSGTNKGLVVTEYSYGDGTFISANPILTLASGTYSSIGIQSFVDVFGPYWTTTKDATAVWGRSNLLSGDKSIGVKGSAYGDGGEVYGIYGEVESGSAVGYAGYFDGQVLATSSMTAAAFYGDGHNLTGVLTSPATFYIVPTTAYLQAPATFYVVRNTDYLQSPATNYIVKSSDYLVAPASFTYQLPGSYITALTGVVTAAGPGSVATTLVGPVPASVLQNALSTGTAFGGDVTGGYGTMVVGNDSHDHALSITGNAAKSTLAQAAVALSNEPTACGASNYVTDISSMGVLTCSVPSGTGIGDVILAGTQTFTGQNTFINPVTVTSSLTVTNGMTLKGLTSSAAGNGLKIGSAYPMTISAYASAYGDGTLWHNAYSEFEGGVLVVKGGTTDTIGARGMRFGTTQAAFPAGGISFYANADSITKDVNYTPTERMKIADNGAVTIPGSDFSVGGSALVVTGGNVGIGTVSPQTKLHISTGALKIDGTTPSIKVGPSYANDYGQMIGAEASAVGASIGFQWSIPTYGVQGRLGTDSANNGYVEVRDYLQAIKTFLPAVGNSYFMGGNVGIGDTAPQAKLTVNGNIHSSGTITTSLGPVAVISATQTFSGANTFQSSVTFSGSIFSSARSSFTNVMGGVVGSAKTQFTTEYATVTLHLTGTNPVQVVVSCTMRSANAGYQMAWGFMYDNTYIEGQSATIGIMSLPDNAGGAGTNMSSTYTIMPASVSKGLHEFSMTIVGPSSRTYWPANSGGSLTQHPCQFGVIELH